MAIPFRKSIVLCCALLLFAFSQPLRSEELANGLIGEFFQIGHRLTNFPVVSPVQPPTYKRIDPVIDFAESNVLAGTDLTDRFSARWRGKIRIPVAGDYTFYLQSDDGSRLFIDGETIVDHGGLHVWSETSATTKLAAGDHDIRLDAFDNEGPWGCSLLWSSAEIKKEIVPATALFHRPMTDDEAERDFRLVPADDPYQLRLWQGSDGLPHTSVTALSQTRDGYFWVGTLRGLARFDGVRFTVFNAKNTPELQEPSVRALCQTSDGVLWVGLGNEGGLIFFKDGKFGRSPIVTNEPVRVLWESRDGALWIGAGNSLIRWHDGVAQRFGESEGWRGNPALSICEESNGKVWIGTTHEVLSYDGTLANMFPGYTANVRALHCDKKDNIWIGTGGGGLSCWRAGSFMHFTKSQGLPDQFVTTIFEDSRGTLWVGTLSGLCRREGEGFTTQFNGEGLSFETVAGLMEDAQGHVWFGSKEGLNQLSSKPFRAFTKRQGISHNNVLSVCEDSRNTLWLGTWGGGVTGMRDGEMLIYNTGNSPLYDLILSVRETRDGNLWLGSEYNGGLFRLRDGAFTHFGQEDGLMDPAIRVMCEDRGGDLWLGTTGALYRMRDGKFTRFTTKEGLAGNTIRALCEDNEGTLWIGTDGGLSRVTEEERRMTNVVFASFTTSDDLSANQILAIHSDADGTLWIGTDGGGLNRMTKSPRRIRNDTETRFSSYRTENGLFDDTIFEILEDDRGYLWMSCPSGIFRVPKTDLEKLDAGEIETFSCVSFGQADGMASALCNGTSKPAGWKAQDGRLWFPTTRGVVVVDPDSIRDNSILPPVVIEGVMADKKTVVESLPEGTIGTLSIPPGRGELEFHYTTLSFREPTKNRFKYKLKGVDSDWVNAGPRRAAYYNNLAPGTYTFHVMGCNSDGRWNTVGASVRLVLRPHFWQTKWFVGFAGVILLGAVGGVSRYVTWKRVQRQLQRLEQQHAVERERARIGKDMHDHIGATLTQVGLLGEMTLRDAGKTEETKRHAGKICATARELGQALDEIVWALNPKNDTVHRLGAYFASYAEEFCHMAGIQCAVEVSPGLPDDPISAEWRHQVFSTAKEALNNVVKHSQATEVEVRFLLRSPQVEISIQDNGKGFDASADPAFGNGVQNMKKRIEDMGGVFAIQSQPGKGTRLSFVVSLPHKRDA